MFTYLLFTCIDVMDTVLTLSTAWQECDEIFDQLSSPRGSGMIPIAMESRRRG